jgi:hypothetical protein
MQHRTTYCTSYRFCIVWTSQVEQVVAIGDFKTSSREIWQARDSSSLACNKGREVHAPCTPDHIRIGEEHETCNRWPCCWRRAYPSILGPWSSSDHVDGWNTCCASICKCTDNVSPFFTQGWPKVSIRGSVENYLVLSIYLPV